MIVTVTLNPSFDKSITINNFKLDVVNKISNSRIDPGGKGINVSKVLNVLGCKNIASGIAGRDNFDSYSALLEENNIHHDIILTNGSIRTNIKINDPINNITTDINESGPILDNIDFENLKSLLIKYKNSASVFVISGSISTGTDPKLILNLVEFLSEMGKKVIVDTSGSALNKAVKAKPYIIKPNLIELSELMGRKPLTHDEIIECAKELISTGIHGIMVTMGGDGLLYVTENCTYHSIGIKVNAMCTVGAGDAVTASLAYGVENIFSDSDMVRLGAALGTAAVMTEGSQAPSLDDIEHYMDKVDVIEL